MGINSATSIAVEIKALRFRFGSSKVVEIDDLQLERGLVHVLLGPSGSGKTTLLRLIAGLLPRNAGAISVNGTIVDNVPPEIGMVFQDIDALPWLTVQRNLTSLPKQISSQEVEAILGRVGLQGAENKFPKELSGGMRKRLAFARLIASGKAIYLMDEPFSFLDVMTRLQVWQVLKALVKQHGITALIVTHDLDEAAYLADRVHIFDGPPLTHADTLAPDESGQVSHAQILKRLSHGWRGRAT
jgi:ABC-type nitrate/sulfonate/bicarbonate transport system ATPase subunit